MGLSSPRCPVYSQLFSIIAPVFLCAGLGYAWARTGTPFDREFVTRTVMNFGAPCLVFRGITGLELPPGDFFAVMVAGAVVMLGCAVVGGVILRVMGYSLRSFIGPVVYGNVGNMGLPLCLFAFGESGLGLGAAIYLLGSSTHFVIMPLIQGRQAAWKTLVSTPIIYGAVLALVVVATETDLPLWADNTIELLGGVAIPLMLLAMGHALAGFRVEHVGISVLVTVLRMGVGVLMGWAVVTAMGLTGIPRGVLLIQSAMPVAVFNYLMSARYHRHPEDVAGSVLISTLVAFLILPALLAWAMGDLL